MNKNLCLNNLFYAGILFSSLDSFPLFSNISTYAPYISVLFFVLYLILVSKPVKATFSRNRLICLFIVIMLYFISLFYGVFIYGELSGFVNFCVQFTIAILLYKSFNCYFKQVNRHTYIQSFARTFITYNIPILIIGILELMLSHAGGIYYNFVSLFSWRVTTGRIQLVSGEPAWASRLLLVILTLIPLANFRKQKTVWLTCLSLVLLLATGSSLGIICVFIYYVVVYFRKQYLKYFVIFGLVGMLLAPSIFNHLNDYTKSRLQLLTELPTSDIETLAVSAGSGSVMARIGNPILGIYVGLDHPIMGVGGGYYYKHHFTYLAKIFPEALSIPNVYETGNSPKNLYSKVFAEMGFMGLMPLLLCFIWVYKNIVKRDKRTLGLFVCIFLLSVNFDTLFHVYPLLLFCLLLNYPTDVKSRNYIISK